MTNFFDPDDGGRMMKSAWADMSRPHPLIAGMMEDDCAVWRSANKIAITSQDFVNLRSAVITSKVGGYYDLARIAVKATISDLASSGAIPEFILCGCRVPENFSKLDFLNIARGIKEEALIYGTNLVGGDTKLGKDFTLIITGYGTADCESQLMLMSQCLPGDDLWVSGEIGSFAAAIYATSYLPLSELNRKWAHEAIRGNIVPLKQARSLAETGKGNGATDLSDGLFKDLSNLCNASNIGASLDLQSVPLAQNTREIALAAGCEPWRFALSCGGDFQFIASVAPEHSALMKSLNFHKIGKMEREPGVRYNFLGNPVLIDPRMAHSDLKGLNFSEEVSRSISTPSGNE